jgi:hypothetical protein
MASKQRTRPLFQLSPEQLALQAARRELKAQKQTQIAGPPLAHSTAHILQREWAPVQHAVKHSNESVSVITWNVGIIYIYRPPERD